MKQLQLRQIITIPIIVGLMISMGINGYHLIQGNPETVSLFMNFYNRTPTADLPGYSMALLMLTGVLQIASALLLIGSIVKGEWQLDNDRATLLCWGLFVGATAITLYGLGVRLISNHQAAANLFYYLGAIYLVLWFVESRSHKPSEHTLLDHIKLLPIIITMIYTMGQPGWQKLINTSEVMGHYVHMFDGSILAQMPGGIPPFIYILGVLEAAVAILLIIALVKREFVAGRKPTFLYLGMLVSATTFVMLAFGLSVLVNFPGATNLIFYSIVTLGLWLYIARGREAV